MSTRRGRLKINNSVGLTQVKEDLRQILKEAHTLGGEALQDAADEIYSESVAIVPYESGELQDSIEVTVSRSPRYPGIIATASAHNKNTGYDYALIQEENEAYNHDPGRQAHYLRDPFEKAVDRFIVRISK